MTLDIAFLFLLVAVMVALFLTEKLSVEITAFAGLSVLIFRGYVTQEEAFDGFSSPAVITMLSIFIVSGALLQTGLADLVGSRIHSWIGAKEIPLIVTVMLVAGVLSAFMNNVAATAVLMPAVASIARRTGLAPSRLFMPLAYGAILGGTSTLVGTPPNILAASMLEERGLEPFGLFDFTPIGLILLGVGVLYMVLVARHFLPARGLAGPGDSAADLTQVYQLRDQLFSIEIPKGSPLDGISLGESHLGTALGVQVLAIVRGGRRHLAPDAGMPISQGDVLLVEGDLTDLQELLQIRDVEIEKINLRHLPKPEHGVSGVRARLSSTSNFAGKTLGELHFRERNGVLVVAIRRNDQLLREQLSQEILQGDDEILGLATPANIDTLRQDADIQIMDAGLSALGQLQDDLFLIRIPDASPMVGSTIASARIGELTGVTVGGLVRSSGIRLGVLPEDRIESGDRLLVVGEPSRILTLLQLGEFQLEASGGESTLESEEVGVVEAAVAPRSSVVGRTLSDLRFRERFGLQVLSVWRSGRPLHTNLARLALRFGDALLLQGPRTKIELLAQERDFIVLTPTEPSIRKEKAPIALLGLGAMIALVVSGFQPIHVAAFVGATLVLLFGALTMEQAYHAIEWKAIFLVAAVLPVGSAMERTGAALLMAESVTQFAGPLGPYAVLLAMVTLSSLLSQGLDGAPAVVLLAPVAIATAQALDMSLYPVMMAVSLAASAAFMTPFSHKANLLVMSVGGYRAVDYLKVGTPLTVILLALMVLLVPLFFPLS